MDYCEDKLVELDLFNTFGDDSAGERNESIVSAFHSIVRGTVRGRSYKQRMTMTKVDFLWLVMHMLFYTGRGKVELTQSPPQLSNPFQYR